MVTSEDLQTAREMFQEVTEGGIPSHPEAGLVGLIRDLNDRIFTPYTPPRVVNKCMDLKALFFQLLEEELAR